MENRIDDCLLTLRDVLTIVPVSKALWYIRVKKRQFPQPVNPGCKPLRWRLSEVLKLARQRIAKQRKREATLCPQCPRCGERNSKLWGSKWIASAKYIQRRRQCKSCGKRYYTKEVLVEPGDRIYYS